MKLNKIQLKNIITPYQKKCGISNLTPYQVSGINKDKEFFENYKINKWNIANIFIKKLLIYLSLAISNKSLNDNI